MPGARGAAAREAFREEVTRRPLGVAQTVYRNLARAQASDPAMTTPGAPASMRAYFKHVVPFG
eukprot:7719576-Lingulodinium_polyedra.AAC.1